MDGSRGGHARTSRSRSLPAAGYLRVGYMDLARFYTSSDRTSTASRTVHELLLATAASTRRAAQRGAHSGAGRGAVRLGLGPRRPAPAGAGRPGSAAAASAAELVPDAVHGRHAVDVLAARRARAAARGRLVRSQPDRHVPQRAHVRSGGCPRERQRHAVLSPGTSGVAYSNSAAGGSDDLLASRRGSRRAPSTAARSSGYENAQTGWGRQLDRQIYMTNNGRIAYGIMSGGVQPVDHVDHGCYNNNVWHHVVATQGAAAWPCTSTVCSSAPTPPRRRTPTTATGGSVAETSPVGRTLRRPAPSSAPSTRSRSTRRRSAPRQVAAHFAAAGI